MQIILGITGGVAAYKAADLARYLTNQGHRVRCILTEAGSRFITPLTLSSLTGQPCYGANPDLGEWRANPIVEHIELARWAELVAVVPATANILGKAANGLATDLLSTVLLATRAPVLWAPAMNTGMWEHPAVQANIARLRTFGHAFVDPGEGVLACGEEGAGKLADVMCIAEAIQMQGTPKLPSLQGRRVLITSGPTPRGSGSRPDPHQPQHRGHGHRTGPGLPGCGRPGPPGAGRGSPGALGRRDGSRSQCPADAGSV